MLILLHPFVSWKDAHPQAHQVAQPQHEGHAQVERVKSAYEQQQEQQRLEAHRAGERRLIQMQQDALQSQRERVLKEREQRLKEEKEREEQQHRDADRREQLMREEHQRSDVQELTVDATLWLTQQSIQQFFWLSCTVIVLIRKRTEYENMDNDIVQGEEEGHDDDEGETERS